ncbi:ribonuclease catalytic domain-containing protein [Desulfoferrobacter suflitae]|uniref:ribonuclease catalytic domain-containing protein n=1 Tax=Desulfoferrobacter suflitae TaxID=2865782 RepID=UPI0021640FB3|nr:ribonuclease catalytic domain-containing protein [Desulfoferrobacter suflitae]MCK8602885.1 ribonuclease catalytic domain-containing protein [Desulfoferrobacter suflitae]
MTHGPLKEIRPGDVLEFFEAKQVICAVCLGLKNQRLTVLTEHNRELNLARSRIIHIGDRTLDLNLTRDAMVRELAAVSIGRESLMAQVEVEELWSLLEGETEGYGANALAEFVFAAPAGDDQVAAVQRVLFQDRLYFQFKDGKFHARSPEKVEQRQLEIEREEQKEARLEAGSKWLKAIWQRKPQPAVTNRDDLIEGLKSFCLFGQESPHYAFAKELLQRADISAHPLSALRILTRLGIWQENENLYLHQHNISLEFSPQVEEVAAARAQAGIGPQHLNEHRRDLRDLHVFTIDGALTRDYDDALSLTVLDNGLFEVGVHIADAAEFVEPGDPVDEEAKERSASIYLPDARISMLPPSLSEDICSLRAGEERLAVSFFIRVDEEGGVHDSEIALSRISVSQQLTYQEVNEQVADDPMLQRLYQLSQRMRKHRLAHGAVILPLPEVQVHVNSAGMIHISQYKKETPSQIIVSEWMIAANGLAASYLAERGIPAIYRSQAECKPETNQVASEHELFHIYRQRRLFARAELDTKPGMHCSLAMPYYTSITSPIRRYIDLLVQRQLKHALREQPPLYQEEELRQLITKLGSMQSKIFLIQRKWVRYWILKYLEQEDIHALDALVLDQNSRFVHLLLPDFLIEANMPVPDKPRLQPGELVRVKISRLSPREDVLRLQI